MDMQIINKIPDIQTEGAAFSPLQIPSFLVTGRALSDYTGSFSLVPKIELHSLWRHNGLIL